MRVAPRHALFLVGIVLATLGLSSAKRKSEKLDASIEVEAADDSSQTEKLVAFGNSSRNDDCNRFCYGKESCKTYPNLCGKCDICANTNSSRNDDCNRLCYGKESCKSYPNLCGKCDICANTAFLKFRGSMVDLTYQTCYQQKKITDELLGNPQPWCGFLFTPEQGCFQAGARLSDGRMYWGCYYVTTVSQEFKFHDHDGKLLYPTGILYDGDFKCGKMEGSGTWFYEDGQAMVTPMKDGKAAGDGLIWSAERDQVFATKDGEVVMDGEGKRQDVPLQQAKAILEKDLKRGMPKKRI